MFTYILCSTFTFTRMNLCSIFCNDRFIICIQVAFYFFHSSTTIMALLLVCCLRYFITICIRPARSLVCDIYATTYPATGSMFRGSFDLSHTITIIMVAGSFAIRAYGILIFTFYRQLTSIFSFSIFTALFTLCIMKMRLRFYYFKHIAVLTG